MKKQAKAGSAFRNRILARLSSADKRRIANKLTRVTAVPRDSLYEPNKPFRHVYFPETGVASILSVLESGLKVRSPRSVMKGWSVCRFFSEQIEVLKDLFGRCRAKLIGCLLK